MASRSGLAEKDVAVRRMSAESGWPKVNNASRIRVILSARLCFVACVCACLRMCVPFRAFVCACVCAFLLFVCLFLCFGVVLHVCVPCAVRL